MRSATVATATSFGLAGAAAIIVPLLAPTQARALVVTVNGQPWDVTTVTGSFGDGTNVGGVNLTNVPWWGDESLAEEFAGRVAGGLHFPNTTFLTQGPFFAFAARPAEGILPPVSLFQVYACKVPDDCSVLGGIDSREKTYATATLVPGPLPILGAAAAFGCSRKLRKRIKGSKLPVASVID